MSKTLTFARTNLARSRELRDELRTIDEAATAAKRDYTANEKQTIEAHRSEITECENRANAILEQEIRGQAIDGGLDRFAGVGLDSGEAAEPTSRPIGRLAPIQFGEAQIRSLYDDFMSGKPATTAIETRAVTAVPMAAVPTYYLNPVTKLRERTRIAQLMPTQTVEGTTATYYTTSTGATAADTVAAGALKPASTPGWTAVDAPIRKIAHFTDVPKEALDDYANFANVVGAEMVAGLYNTESLQLLNGSGIAPDIDGLLQTAGINAYAPAIAEARYVSIREAIAQLQAEFIEPDVIVLHPADAKLFDLTNSASAGLHANMDVAADGTRTAWGLRIVVTSQIASGTAMVANLAESTVLFMREPANIFVDPYSQSSSNLVRFICEERLGLGATRPDGILAITFNGTA